MKPGSSARCTSKFRHLRCHHRFGHDGFHGAPTGKGYTVWDDAPAEG